jgi:hypothetical protein
MTDSSSQQTFVVRRDHLARAWLSISNAADVACHCGDVYLERQLTPVVLAIKAALDEANSTDSTVVIRVEP